MAWIRGYEMKKYVKKLTFTNKNVLKKVLCNMCGKSIETGVLKNQITKDYISINKRWGFLSSKDLEIHSVDLCEECYDKLVETFVIPPTIKKDSIFR